LKEDHVKTVSSVPHIERLDFFNGQRLFAEDLQTLDGFNRQMRWLHNLSLHTFGIGSGFAVQGAPGDREVAILPGYAIDREGREIILLVPRVETVPPVADDGSGNPRFYDLTVHYPHDEDLEELETRAGICATHGVVRRREEPVFCWIELQPDRKPKHDVHAQQIANGEKIVLARVSVKNCQLETLSIATRRDVRPERLPYVACGRTAKGGTDWQPWTVNVPGDNDGTDTITLGVYVRVDTSGAKFASVPRYTARIVGKREFLNQDSGKNYILEGITSIDLDVTPSAFTLRVFLPPFEFNGLLKVNPISGLTKVSDVLAKAGWYVEWMGVEG
jgi:hypothetical protein